MPRISFATYCERRTKLSQVWQDSRDDFSGLSPKEQWALHGYYRFAEALSPKQLHEHWTEQRTKSSSLAQRAGRAYAAFELVLANKPVLVKDMAQPVARKRKRDVKYKVRSLVRPEPDMRKLAKALLSVVQQEVAVLAKGDGGRIIQSNEQKTNH